MSWLNKSLSQLSDVSASISSFTQDVLAAEPPPVDDFSNDQISEYRSQIEYYKREVDRLKNGDTIESKIRLDELNRQFDSELQKNDDLSLQVTNLAEELEESINENNKLAKRNSFLSKQSTTLTTKNNTLEKDNATLQKSLEEVDQIHEEELQEVLRQRDEIKSKFVQNSETDPNASLLEENEKLKTQIFDLKKSAKSSTHSTPPSSPSPDSDLKLKMAKLSKTLKSKISDLESKLATEKSKNSEISTQKDDEIKLLIEKVEDAENLNRAETEKLKLETENLQNQLNSQNSEILSAQAESEKFAKKSENLENQLKLLSEENSKSSTENFEGKMIEIQSTNQELETENERLRLQAADFSQKLETNFQTIENLQANLDEVENSQKNLENSNSENLSALEAELESTRRELISNVQKIENAEKVHKSEMLEISEKCKSELENFKSSKEMELKVLMANHQSDVDQLHVELKKSQFNSQTAADAESHALVQNMEQNFETQLFQLSEKHKISISEMEQNHQAALEQARVNSQADTDNQIEAIRQELNTEKELVKNLEEHHKTELLQISETINELESSKHDLEKSHQVDIDQLKSQFNSQTNTDADLQAAHDELNNHKSELQQLTEKVHLLESSKTDLEHRHQVALEQTKLNSNTDTDAQIEAIRHELNAEKELVKSLEEHHNTELLQLSEKVHHLENVNHQLEETYQKKIDELNSQLNSQPDAGVEFQTVRQELENAHQAELDKIRSELSAAQVNSRTSDAAKSELEVKASELEELRVKLSSTLEKLEDAESAAEEAASILQQLKLVELKNHELTENLKNISERKGALENQIRNKDGMLADLENRAAVGEALRTELDQAKKMVQGLQNGNVLLQNTIATLEKEKLMLKTRQVDGESDATSELHQHINQLTSVVQQREAQLQLSLKRNNELGDELKRMHEAHQSRLTERTADTLLEEQLAHLEAEKEHLHQVLNEKTREATELANRLQETGGALQMRSKQLDELATDIQDAKRAKERAEMTQEAMNKLSHLIRAKDVEIEALKNKTESLTEILRNSDASDQSAQIIKLMEQGEAQRTAHQKTGAERDQILQAYNQLEHSVVVLKSEFESIQKSYREEIQICNQAVNSFTKQQEVTETHELEISTLKNLVKKIRAKSMTLKPREAPDGSETPNHLVPNGNPVANGFTDNELLTSSVRNLKDRCAALEAKNTAMKRDNDALRDQLMDRREKWDALEITNQNLAKEVANRDARLAEVKIGHENFLATIEQKSEIIAGLERDGKELIRLREHLVQIEEEHGIEIVKIQESETKLQEQVDALRDGLHDVTGARNDLEEQQLENARDQKLKEKNLNFELNDAKRREKGFEKTIKELQQFIEHFRQQQELSMAERDRAHATQLQRAERESHSLRQETKQLRGRMEAAEQRSNESEHLRLQLHQKEEKFDRLRYIIDEKAIEVDNLRQRLADAHEAAQKTVDKALAKNIVLKYLSLPSAKKQEGNKILGAVFGLSDEELFQADGAGLGWRGWFRPPTSAPPTMDPNKSFSELLVTFLNDNSERGGQASHMPSFPVNQMVGDVGRSNRKHSSDRDSGIEGRNTLVSNNPLLAPMMPSNQKHQNALLKGLLDD